MHRINLFELVELGEAIKNTTGITDKDEPFDAYIKVHALDLALRKLVDNKAIQFDLTDHNILTVQEAIEGIRVRCTEKDKNGNVVCDLGFAARWKFNQSLSDFRTVMAAEFRGASTYFVGKVGIYSTNDLIENASNRFREELREKIDKKAMLQFQEAARCLAFGLNTSCGFHMMRAIECSLLSLMKAICGRKFVSLNTNWGSYIAEIERVIASTKRKKPTQETVDLMRQIKNNHRNPVMHAELDLSAQEAMDIFDMGAVVISHLTEEVFRLS